MAKIPKKVDFIKGIIGQKMFNIRNIFDLPLKITVGEFFNCLD